MKKLLFAFFVLTVVLGSTSLQAKTRIVFHLLVMMKGKSPWIHQGL